jgi:hypothetical protein
MVERLRTVVSTNPSFVARREQIGRDAVTLLKFHVWTELNQSHNDPLEAHVCFEYGLLVESRVSSHLRKAKARRLT